MSARAECTWAEGPDVLLVIDKINASGFPLSTHEDGLSSVGLSRAEARALAAELLAACERADALERSLEVYESSRGKA